MIERRRNVRHPKYKSASIVFNRLGSVISCTLRNASEGGACLVVPSYVFIPAKFDLHSEGAARPCTIAWRRPDRIGVQYG